MRRIVAKSTLALLVSATALMQGDARADDAFAANFAAPPDAARPGVYWYFMDGNLSRAGMTADLKAMQEAGIGNLVFLEVNVGVPRGNVDFLSDQWQELFVHAVREAERLGIEITLGSGPGWAGSGGPWVKPAQSMQHLVAAAKELKGPLRFQGMLPRPPSRKPYFAGALTSELTALRESFYEDVALLAFPSPEGNERIADIDEKALYYREPYTSKSGVKPYLHAPADFPVVPPATVIEPGSIVDLTDHLQPDGRVEWDVPAGNWTALRFGRRNNGATTRPAPTPGLGFECDKFDKTAFDAHFDAYMGKLLVKVGPRQKGRGWTMVHIDSWEMGAQNWTPTFREEFARRRGYDLLPFLPVYTGRIVGSLERSERFLWDLRLTAQELVIENHARRLKELGHQHGMGLSIEPYDMNPTSDLELGAVADVPMCEFWSKGYGFDSSFSCFEAVSIAHTNGRSVVAAEAFTAGSDEAWKLFPAAVKNQGDWAFCTGINRFVYHTFAHKPNERRPGMTMGPYGVHWDRGQTWWPMVSAYHRYITRCQFMLRQGQGVADICYLIPEGAPHVFRPPPSALDGHGSLRDRRGYNFDGCSPNTLIEKATVDDGHLVFEGGTTYRLLVLPSFETMTPVLLRKIKELVAAGATVIGPPPRKSPSLVDYPQCDQQVAALAKSLWGQQEPPDRVVERSFGQGRVVWGGDLRVNLSQSSESRSIQGAHWIWYPEGKPAAMAEPGRRYFRRVFGVNPKRSVRSARLEITADNAFEVSINGKPLPGGGNFHNIYALDVKACLKAGCNVVAVKVTNTGETPNPAGLIAAVRLEYEDGSELIVPTDGRWETKRAVETNKSRWWSLTKRWKPAMKLGPADMAPWRLSDSRTDNFPDLYPDYGATAGILAQMNLSPDFESNGPIRYTHRRLETSDIYFVANQEARRSEATCKFRVAGRAPELWDPLTGATRELPDFTVEEGRTAVPLQFEPHQSFLVVFRKKAANRGPQSERGRNFVKLEKCGRIDGPWDVSFDPSLGGPRHVEFATLEDWSGRPEPGIKYYSGIATYRVSFDLPKTVRRNRRLRLDLGKVHSMAQARLNGRDLGVVWCDPWSVDITSAVQASGNRLEIEVANLWPNRLIGDKGLPPEQRVSWTTFNPYTENSPLLPSGLLGPLTIWQPESD